MNNTNDQENTSYFSEAYLGAVPKHFKESIIHFFQGYTKIAENSGVPQEHCKKLSETFLKLFFEQLKNPFQFGLYHQAIRKPFDYYTFGLEFVRIMLDAKASTVQTKKQLQEINEAISRKENVILFANHQTEIDPQIISLLLEKEFPKLAEEMIFVAGHRVITDPMATPLSLGRNLLCIYSKRHIDNPPELKTEKLLHNSRTLKAMEELLQEGGKCIYVAPSGGRDRMNSEGIIEVAPFDPQSIEMLYLISLKSPKKTHFHTLALSTYHILPPPDTILQDIGEQRIAGFAPAHLAFGPEIEMNPVDGELLQDKKLKRKLRAESMWQQVVNDYQAFPKT